MVEVPAVTSSSAARREISFCGSDASRRASFMPCAWCARGPRRGCWRGVPQKCVRAAHARGLFASAPLARGTGGAHARTRGAHTAARPARGLARLAWLASRRGVGGERAGAACMAGAAGLGSATCSMSSSTVPSPTSSQPSVPGRGWPGSMIATHFISSSISANTRFHARSGDHQPVINALASAAVDGAAACAGVVVPGARGARGALAPRPLVPGPLR